ncbi:Response regulator [Sulfidibacter corallicola]|uniref:histidine kinase n=1 Tax=Sulfidibacter corallicola TaxID=2818388 RepID=A0A8A4TW04_SULCO|nr:PAS domain-containing hybrid sensor histidine kinase/response regulator [Sulfidibacter corallicola]QTD53537.1 response regulator [Sulfidibacter corallicola]
MNRPTTAKISEGALAAMPELNEILRAMSLEPRAFDARAAKPDNPADRPALLVVEADLEAEPMAQLCAEAAIRDVPVVVVAKPDDIAGGTAARDLGAVETLIAGEAPAFVRHRLDQARRLRPPQARQASLDDDLESTGWDLLDALCNRVPVGLYLFRLTDRENLDSMLLVRANRAATVITGRDYTNKLGRPWREGIPELSARDLEPHFQQVLHHNEPTETFETTFSDRSGKDLYFRLIAFHLTGPFLGIMFKDVSEQRIAEQVKISFLSQMSHELRTPLNGILGCAQILKRDIQEPSQAKHVDLIEQCGQNLLTIFNDIMDHTHIEAGLIKLTPDKVNPLEFLNKTADRFAEKARKKGLGFQARYDDNLPSRVSMDTRKLERVLRQLLGNALHRLDQGSVSFQVTYRPGRTRFEIAEVDGKPNDEAQSQFFRKFRQIQDAHLMSEGADLGFSICKRFVGLMGGALILETPSEQGSRLWFEIETPVIDETPAERKPSKRIIGYRGPKRRILVVDDDQVNLLLQSEILGSLGFEVIPVNSGEACVNSVSETPVDAIIMDLRMPGMNGFETAQRLKAGNLLGKACMIATSAEDGESTREAAHKAQFDGFLAKPVQSGQLMEILCERLGLDPICEQRETNTATLRETGGQVGNLNTLPRAFQEDLIRLAESGDVAGLIRWSNRLSEEPSGDWQDIARRVASLADNFEMLQLKTWVRRQIP